MAIRILVVDDASFIRDMIKKQLRDRIPSVEIFDAVDGNRALATLKSHPIDLILSDWEMPNMSGEELLANIRNQPQYERMPFIMISSRGDRSHIIRAIELGVSDYLTKPFTADELIKKVVKQLKRIGKKWQDTRQPAATQGIAFSSVDVLTGKPAIAKPADTPEPAAAAPSASSSHKGRAQLRLSNNRTFACVIREMSLQLIHCLVPRTEGLPGIFDQVVVDIELSPEEFARVNGYIHAIQASEARPDAKSVKILVRLVDNDAEKFDALSRYIAKL